MYSSIRGLTHGKYVSLILILHVTPARASQNHVLAAFLVNGQPIATFNNIIIMAL